MKVKFSECVEYMIKGPFGSDMKKSLYVPQGENTYKVYIQGNALQKDEKLGDYYVSSEYFHQKLERFQVHPGDYLITCDGTLGKYIKLSDDIEPGVISSSLLLLKLDENKIYDKYFELLWEQSMLRYLASQARNACLVHLPSAKAIGDVEIVLPDMSIQKEIADKAFLIKAIIKKRNDELELLDELIKARFVELFGDKGYPEDTLLNLCNIIDYRGKTPEKVESGLPFITAKNVRMHQMNLEPREYISKETYDKVMVRGFPKEGDVVFTTEAPLGNVCRIPHFDTEFYIGQRIVTLQTEKLEPIYLEYALSSDDFKMKYMGKSSGSTVTGIRVRLLEQLTIPVPPIELQSQFAAFVEQTDKSKFENHNFISGY